MRRAAMLAGGLACAAAVAGMAASGGSAQEQPGSVIELVTEHTGGFRVDNRPQGPSAGDTFGFRETLSADGRRVGRGHGVCTAVTRRIAECSVTSILEDGTIAVRLVQDFSRNRAVAAVVGGTGAYSSARGQATVQIGRRGNRITIALAD